MTNASVTRDQLADSAANDKPLKKAAARSSVTKVAEFNAVPAANANLMSVAAGVDSFFALSQSEALESAVQTMLRESVDGGMSGELAYLCKFAMDAAAALRYAARASV